MYSGAAITRKKPVEPLLFDGGDFQIAVKDVMTAIKDYPILQASTVRQWEWHPGSRRYSHEGKSYSPKEIYNMAEFIQQNAAAQISTLDLEKEWTEKARQIIKEEYIRQYILGRGGLGQMTPADWGRVGNALRTQYQYMKDLPTRNYSTRQLANVLTMYTDSATAMFERARAATYAVDLPAYPGDGTTECHVRCACTWEYQTDNGMLLAYWTLGPVETEHCETCVERSKNWAPFLGV